MGLETDEFKKELFLKIVDIVGKLMRVKNPVTRSVYRDMLLSQVERFESDPTANWLITPVNANSSFLNQPWKIEFFQTELKRQLSEPFFTSDPFAQKGLIECKLKLVNEHSAEPFVMKSYFRHFVEVGLGMTLEGD